MPKRKSAKEEPILRINTHGPFAWYDMRNPDRAMLKELKKKFPFFDDEDLNDCLPPFQRPKLLRRNQYLFLVLLFPITNQRTQVIEPYEVDMFIGPDFLVTSHLGHHPTMVEVASACETDTDACAVSANSTSLRLALDITHSLTIACFPMVTELSNQLIGMEHELFSDELDGDTARQMLRLRTDIVTFRKTMQGSDTVLRKVLDRGELLFPVSDCRPLVDDINSHSGEIRDFLDNDRDTIVALYDAHLALVSYRATQATRKLTALAFVIFPMTLVAAVFAMRAEHMPFLGRADDFWIMLGFIFLTMLLILLYLRKKRWL